MIIRAWILMGDQRRETTFVAPDDLLEDIAKDREHRGRIGGAIDEIVWEWRHYQISYGWSAVGLFEEAGGLTGFGGMGLPCIYEEAVPNTRIEYRGTIPIFH